MGKEEAYKFYSDAKEEYFKWLNEMKELIQRGVILAQVSDQNFLDDLKRKMAEKGNLLVNKYLGKIPDEHLPHFSDKMRGTFTKWGKMAFRGDYVIDFSLRDLEKEKLFSDLGELRKSELPERVKYYLEQSRKCYAIGAYDASIVMAGRAVEFTFKEYFKNEKVDYEDKWMLGSLVDKFKSLIGRQKIEDSDKILQNVSEVLRLFRNTTAHDNPHTASKEEADLVWDSTKFVIKSLL